MHRIPTNPLFWSLAVFLFPLLIEVSYSDFVREGEYNSRIGWSFITALLITLANRRWATALVLLPFMLGGIADIGYAYTFGGVFTTATLEAVAYTDSSEVAEFAGAYASVMLFSLYGIHWLLYAGAIYFSKPVTNIGWRRTIYSLGILLIIVVSYRTSVMGRFHDTIPGVLGTIPSYYRGAVSLEHEVELRKAMLASTPVTASIKDKRSQIHIFVIGESLNRSHMGLYGYHRDTTPYLSARQPELVTFTDAISSHAQTQASLRVALTAADSENGHDYRQALSVIDLANLAGYKTWWISNQQPQRATIASIAHQADTAHYISNDFKGVEVRRFDEYLLPVLNQALDDDAPHKAIFIHTMGSHAKYANRYPESYHQFTGNDVVSYREDPSSYEVGAINEYDNSVLYSDYVAETMIRALEQAENAEVKTFTLFSDHGEEVYRSAKIKGHSPDNVTANMVEIPLIVWSSNNEKLKTALENNQHKGFMLDDLFHLTGGILGIESGVIQKDKDISSSHYLSNNQRIIYNKEYDKVFKRDYQTAND